MNTKLSSSGRALLAAIFFLAPCAGRGATFSTNPLADALVAAGAGGVLSANNFGGAGGLAVAAGALPKGEFQSVLQFDLAGARGSCDAQFGAGQWTLSSVTLQLTTANNNNPGFFNSTAAGQFGISLLQNNSWLEGTGTPAAPTTDGISYDSLLNTFVDNADDQALGTFSFGGGSTGANSYSLKLASGLVAELQAGHRLSLRLFAADDHVSYLFNSRTIAASANRPVLVVSVVPEPSTAFLSLAGLAIAALQRASRGRRSRATD